MAKFKLQNALEYMFARLDHPLIFIIGFVITGILGNLFFELGKNLANRWEKPWWVVELGFIGLFVLIACMVYYVIYKPTFEKKTLEQEWNYTPRHEHALQRSYPGMIWLLSPVMPSMTFTLTKLKRTSWKNMKLSLI